MKRSVVFVSMIAAGCAPFPHGTAAANRVFAKATPMCAVLAKPQAYIGQRVLVSGTYFVSPHGPSFYDETCAGHIALDSNSGFSEDHDKRAVSTIRVAIAGDVRKAVPIVLEGMLIGPSPIAPAPVLYCSGGATCSEYQLREWKIVAAGAVLKRTDL